MKKYYLVLIAIFIYSSGIACTIIPETFCRTIELFPERLIVSGKIVSIDDTGLDLEIIDIIRGEESRTVIRIWDGTDFECNGTFSLAASTIGEVHDTVVIILPKITEIENEWDVIDDFRRPDPYQNITELRVKEGIAKGFIQGFAGAPSGNLYSIDYEELKQKLIEEGDCSTLISSTNEASKISQIKFNNPINDMLNIQLGEVLFRGALSIYSLRGEMVAREEIRNQEKLEIELFDLPTGIYIVQIRNANKWLVNLRIVKL